MDPAARDHFDDLLDGVIRRLPPDIHQLLEEVPLIVEDYPAEEIIDAFELESPDELCGLHDGIPLTERTVEASVEGVPDHIMIYRLGVIAAATDNAGLVSDAELQTQIRITVLHEIGHHFGLEEDDLAKLGYD